MTSRPSGTARTPGTGSNGATSGNLSRTATANNTARPGIITRTARAAGGGSARVVKPQSDRESKRTPLVVSSARLEGARNNSINCRRNSVDMLPASYRMSVNEGGVIANDLTAQGLPTGK